MPFDELIRIAFVASGVPPEDLDGPAAEMAEIAASSPPATGDPIRDGEALLEWMHQEHLSRYIENQTRLDVLLDQGTYNCVSSAVFYMLLARARGVPVHGVLTTDHAFCRIPTEGGGVDVETTSPYGFDPGTRREAVESFTGRTGFTYVPPGNYRLRRDIGERELISLIYQNRIAALQRSGDWAATVGLARDRWELAGSEDAARDFRTSLSNYAAEMDRRRKNVEALRFLALAAGEPGLSLGLEETAGNLLGNAVSRLLGEGRIDEARALLDDGELTALVPAEYVALRREDASRTELDLIIRSGDFDGALEAVDAALASGLIAQDRWEESALYLWSSEARRRSVGGNWIEGWTFLLTAPTGMTSVRGWSGLVESYRHNAAVVYHNRFADAFRKNRFEEARSVLAEALSLFPDDATLNRDLQILEAQDGG